MHLRVAPLKLNPQIPHLLLLVGALAMSASACRVTGTESASVDTSQNCVVISQLDGRDSLIMIVSGADGGRCSEVR